MRKYVEIHLANKGNTESRLDESSDNAIQTFGKVLGICEVNTLSVGWNAEPRLSTLRGSFCYLDPPLESCLVVLRHGLSSIMRGSQTRLFDGNFHANGQTAVIQGMPLFGYHNIQPLLKRHCAFSGYGLNGTSQRHDPATSRHLIGLGHLSPTGTSFGVAGKTPQSRE
ncbi:hypothetical protein CH063_08629 [Colletotrichum higginsianum]|uniref:Uncharacterized protein n=1 Tax=Colletotrichum higginsianum (strain IMI 349063) TaxID=759273 RepID=H1VAJ4_COLHI|nr:hypothetical protein CH063_08629 [Colletotrichum higginsianum]